MADIINNLEGYFIGRVVGYDKNTREIDVFIPKLMPAIPDGQKDVKIMTNFGNSSINIKHNQNITTSSSIKVRSFDMRQQLPDIDSKVFIIFLEGRFEWGFWLPFNINDDYEIIEEEKYQDLNYITLGGYKTLIKEFDNIQIELPKGFSVILNEDPKTKIKKFKITQDQEAIDRIENLEELVGNDDCVINYTDNNGNNRKKTELSKGLYKKVNHINNKIDDLQKIIGTSGIKYEYKEIKENKYDENFDYFIHSNNEYIELGLSSIEGLDKKEEFLESLLLEGFTVCQGKKIFDEANGIYAKIENLEKRLLNLESINKKK